LKPSIRAKAEREQERWTPGPEKRRTPERSDWIDVVLAAETDVLSRVPYHVKEDKKNMLAVHLVLEGPTGLEYDGFPADWGGFPVGVEFEGGVAVEDFPEEVEGLFIGDLIGKGDGGRQGNIDVTIDIEEGVQIGRIILEEGLFDVLGGIVQRQG
jgi:hypothetical protein